MALDGTMENLGPFDDAMGKLETLNKAMGKRGGGPKWPDGGKREIGPLMAQIMEHLGAFWWYNRQIRDPNNGKIGVPDDLMGKLGP